MAKASQKRDSSGQGMTEYILIVALIAVAVIAAVKYFGHSTSADFKNAADSVTGSVNEGIATGLGH